MNIVERAKKLRDASYSIKDESQVKADLKGVAELMVLHSLPPFLLLLHFKLLSLSIFIYA